MVEHNLAKVGVVGSSPIVRSKLNAGIAQLGERFTCNEDVAGSIPAIGSKLKSCLHLRKTDYNSLELNQLRIRK